MNQIDPTFTVTETEMDLARRACQLTSVRMVRTQLAKDERYVIQFDGRHADEAAALFLQMLMRR